MNKAIVYTKYGSIDVLGLEETQKPSPNDDEVLVKVQAVSINDWDFGLMEGDFINRLLNGLWKPKRKILGSDIAGRVEAIGKKVTRFKTGDEVYGDLSGRWGGFAEYTCANENAVVVKPAGMSFVLAASIPQAAMLAVQGLIDKGKIKRCQKVLINGAGGGVGTFAIQLAGLYDAEVTGVDHTRKLDRLRTLGLEHVIDYTKEDFTLSGRLYDLILDVKTDRSIFSYMRSLLPGGRYVSVGGSTGRLLQAAMLAPWIARTAKKYVQVVALKPNKDLPYINNLFEEGKIRPVIEGPFVLDHFREAFRIFARSEHTGKVVITM